RARNDERDRAEDDDCPVEQGHGAVDPPHRRAGPRCRHDDGLAEIDAVRAHEPASMASLIRRAQFSFLLAYSFQAVSRRRPRPAWTALASRSWTVAPAAP